MAARVRAHRPPPAEILAMPNSARVARDGPVGGVTSPSG